MGRTIVVHDTMQRGYRYTLSEPVGKHFAPGFKPQLTPSEMLRLGVFGGVYLRDCGSEFPRSWFARAKFQKKGSYVHDPALNYFGVNASQPLAEWRRKGWLYREDPRGWFQWYCRYYLGRRCSDDERQIKRWKAFARHAAQVRASCRPGDPACHTKQRQALLHWAYDSRKL